MAGEPQRKILNVLREAKEDLQSELSSELEPQLADDEETARKGRDTHADKAASESSE